ncbi:uncharacterized protein LOC115734818 [Rhodamnia argentea]|uniref:Uncharacterized protein LOC115734818 n=1 Tax=Rhodamnia argentea TaxID=178133 RepID=A0A8B8NGM5_9MYRT|nr:uncharacterized protein LOC115734818 [Rhodamnia argentea]
MEQRSSNNDGSGNGNRDGIAEEKNKMIHDVGFPVHSQVRKIKQESDATAVDWSTVQPEMRPVLRAREIIKQQRSRSPLGLAAGRPISIGDP